MRTRPDIPLILEVMSVASPSSSTRLGVAFGQISRYLIFLNLVVDRYRGVSQRYVENLNALVQMSSTMMVLRRSRLRYQTKYRGLLPLF